MTYTDSYGPDSDGDPVQDANGGEVIPMHFVINGQGDMAAGLSKIDSAGSGNAVPLGPCA